MAELPAKQSVFTRVRNSILNAGITNNFTRNIIANFAPNIFGSNLIDFVSISDNANLDKTMELISSMNSQTIQANYNAISRKFFSISSQFNTEAVINRILDTLNQETRQTLSEEMLKDDNIIFSYGKVTDEICEKIVSGIDFQTKTSEEIDQMIESVKPSRKISYNLFSQLTLSQKKDFFSTFSEQFLTLPLGNEKGLKDMLEQFDEPDRLEQYNKILKSCANYENKNDNKFDDIIKNLVNCFQTLDPKDRSNTLDRTISLLRLESKGKFKNGNIISVMNCIKPEEQKKYCKDFLHEMDLINGGYYQYFLTLDKSTHADIAKDIINIISKKQMIYSYDYEIVDSLERDARCSAFLEIINGDIDDTTIDFVLGTFFSEERQKDFISYIKQNNLQIVSPERMQELEENEYPIEDFILIATDTECNRFINEYLNNKSTNKYISTLNSIKGLYTDIDASNNKCQKIKMDNIANLFSTLTIEEKKRLLDTTLTVAFEDEKMDSIREYGSIKIFEGLSQEERTQMFSGFYEYVKEKPDTAIKLYDMLPDEGKVKVFEAYSSLDTPESLNFLITVLQKHSIKELNQIFQNKVTLSQEKIEKMMQQQSGIAVKTLLFDADTDRDKLTDLAAYSQLQDNKAIDIDSVVQELYINAGKDKKEFNTILNDVYNLFTYNNVPEFLKTFRIFQLGNFHNKSNNKLQSFQEKTTQERDILILEDLFKISLDSNSASLREFAEIIMEGKRLTTLLQSNPEEKIETLSIEERALLMQYRDTLYDLHNITRETRNTGKPKIEKTDNVIGDLRTLISVYSDNKDHNVDSKNIVFNPNKIMDELFKGFVTTTIRPRAMLEYMDRVKENADARHLKIEEQLRAGTMHLQEGDFIKGILNFDDYIPSMLQDGIKGGEFNQEYSHSDATPLDADFGYISSGNLTIQKASDYDIIQTTISAGYGPNYVVLKQYAERLADRQSTNFENQATFNGTTDFYEEMSENNRASRYIRTGIPITDVDYIVSVDWNPKNGYEMAMAGMYIPVIDSKGEVVFSSEDYKKIREEMRGLSRYHAEDIIVSDKARNMEALYETYRKVSTKSAEETEKEIEAVKALVEGKEDETTSKKKKATTDFIKGYFESKGIRVVDDLSQNLSTNSVELIDTGSTGRGTNVPGDGDFDFMLRHNLPDDILEELTQKVGEITPKEDFAIVSDGFRSKGAVLPNGEVVDIDVTAAKKDLALSYSSDMCVRDRLDNIRTHSPADYNYVQANIIMAKKILKAEGVYKKAGSTGATKYGGFGGIGVENWVLQNGGSFEQALDTFMDTANQAVDYNDFKRKYPIFDFGFNHREGKTRHDRFSAFLGVDSQYPIGFNYVKEIFPTLQQTMTLENEKQSERENGIEPESPLMQSISAKGFAEAGKNKSDLRNKFSFSQIRGLVAKYMSMQSVQQETQNTNNSLEEKDD